MRRTKNRLFRVFLLVAVLVAPLSLGASRSEAGYYGYGVRGGSRYGSSFRNPYYAKKSFYAKSYGGRYRGYGFGGYSRGYRGRY